MSTSRVVTFLLATAVVLMKVDAFIDYGNIYPERFHIGTSPQRNCVTTSPNQAFTLSQISPTLTLDYGTEVAGIPIFEVLSASGSVQIEVKYAEEFDALVHPYSDGPWTFSNGLSNTFRVETFNITAEGSIQSFFVQGGQRWQTVRLLTAGAVSLRAGMRSTSEHSQIQELPGTLETSNEQYNKIFGLGGRVAQVACIDAGNAPSTWEMTKSGVRIRGQATAQSIKGISQANYTMSFDTKIEQGGIGWRVASGGINPTGSYFVLTSNYSEDATFVNTNRTLLPPHTLVYNYGWSLVNQSTLTTGWNEYYPISNVSIEENRWYRISTTISETGFSISLDGHTIAFVPIAQAQFLLSSALSTLGATSPYEGSWGFGGFQDQISLIKNVRVTSASDGLIYNNTLLENAGETFAEYNVAPLDHSVCLDGAKRDRLVWIGDFYHTVRVIAHSTARWDYVLGSLDYVFQFQSNSGLVPISANLGLRPDNKESYTTGTAYLLDYQDLLLAAIGQYYRYTGDFQGLKPKWENIKKLAAAKSAFIDPYSGLMGNFPDGTPAFNFLGPVNGTAITGLHAFALDLLIPVAEAMNDTNAAETYKATADGLRMAMNNHLWNADLGTYSLSVADQGNFSLTAIAMSILSGASNPKKAQSSIAKLEELILGVGYRTTSSDAQAEEYELSPNISGFLLEALFLCRHTYNFDTDANTSAHISHLLNNLWGSMVNNDTYYSGASWEYVHPNGSPGIDLFTSLAHPWGAAPTYVLPEYLLGVQATAPGFRTFIVRPMVGLLGLVRVRGTVPTPLGGINVSWERDAKTEAWVMEVEAPNGMDGEIVLPRGGQRHSDEWDHTEAVQQLHGGRTTRISFKDI